MDPERLNKILESIKSGELSVDEAAEQVRKLTFVDLGFARVDHHREKRCGFPEVIFCQGKTPEQVARISQSLVGAGSNLLATRAREPHYQAVKKIYPEAEWHPDSGVITLKRSEPPRPKGFILVICAGTSDIPVAEEARLTADIMGNEVKPIYDVGVAGIHRLLAYHEELADASALIVVAGMEGALASVVGGLVAKPVIAVPTSVGYGASFNGLAPLLTMLNSCAAGVTVVNIDNGFGAGYFASLVNRQGLSDE